MVGDCVQVCFQNVWKFFVEDAEVWLVNGWKYGCCVEVWGMCECMVVNVQKYGW